MYTSAFNNIFAELIVNDKEEYRRYVRINTAAYHYFFFVWQNNQYVLYYTSLNKYPLIQWSHCGSFSTATLFDIWLLSEQHEDVEVFITDAMLLTVTCSWFFSRLLEFSLMSLCKNSFSSSSNARLPSSILKENRRNSSHWGMFCKKGVLLCHVSLLRTLLD